MGRCGLCLGSFVVCPKRIPTCNTMLRFLPKESIVFDCAALISPAAAVRAAGVLMHCPQPRKIRQREELSRIASVKLKKAVTAAKQAVSPRVLAFCVMVVCLVATLGVTAANLRLTYVTDSNGAKQVIHGRSL